MSSETNNLLASLKNFAKCNQDLTTSVKRALLDPLQNNSATRDSFQRLPLSIVENNLKTKARYLVPLALRIVNQNIGSLKELKEWIRRGHSGSTANINTIKQCLIDTSFYAISALKHMHHVSSLKHLDIEKTTSNLICKLVDLGEWKRSLEELRKLRYQLANIANIQLDNTPTTTLLSVSRTRTVSNTPDCQYTRVDYSSANNKNLSNCQYLPANNVLTSEAISAKSSNQQRCITPHRDLSTPSDSTSCASVLASDSGLIVPSFHLDMVTEYADLFSFPVDANVMDRSLILLVLAYQMNVIRSWGDIDNGAMVKYIGILLDQPGNFIDWCKHLMSCDDVMAKKQLDLLQRHLVFTVNKVSSFDSPTQSIAIECIALIASAYTDMIALPSLCDQFLRLTVIYEKNAQGKYDNLQKYCANLFGILRSKSKDLSHYESYLDFCEYYTYISRKVNINSGVIESLMSMDQVLCRPVDPSRMVDYYRVAYSTHVKLSLCAAQMDQMTLSNSYIDIITLVTDTSSSIQSLTHIIRNDTLENNDQTKQITVKLFNVIYSFIRSANQVLEMIRKSSNNHPSAQCLLESQSLQLSSLWKLYTNTMADLIQQCSVLVPIILAAAKELGWANYEPETALSPSVMVLTNVDILILLAKLQYDNRNDATYHQAYNHLATAEQLCSVNMVSSGYRWISAAYYTLGTSMITIDSFSNAIYPLRKSCTLLEKDSERMDSVAGKTQLVKRYDILGTCCQKSGDLAGAIKAYRLALNYLPSTTISSFTTGSCEMTISKMIQQQPLVPKLIDHFILLSLKNNEQSTSATKLMDLSTLTATQKCILYEYELKILLLSTRHDLVESQSRLIDLLLHHYTADQYPIHRGRALLYQVQKIHANGLAEEKSLHAGIKYAQEAYEILTNKDYESDTDLLPYRRHYLALACSWLGILQHELNEISPDAFVLALQHWGKLFKKIKPLSSTYSTTKEQVEEICQQVDDIENLYGHFQLLADLFGLTGHFTLQINTLRLLLKLNNGLRESKGHQISDSIIITTDIGHIYMNLGYSGKAKLEFEKAKRIKERFSCTPQAEIHYLIQQCQYLSTIGDYDKSMATLDAAKTIWEASDDLGNCKKSLLSMNVQAIKYFTLSDCYLARSTISLHKESLNSAILDANWSYQILCDFLQTIKPQARSEPTENSFLTEIKDQHQSLGATSDAIFKKYQWKTAMKLGHVLQRLASLHMTHGTWRDAQYYLVQGQQLGEKVKSNAMVYQFLILLHDSYLRTDQVNKSRPILEAANEIRSKGHAYLKEEAQLTIAIGHSNAKQNIMDKAMESFDYADLLYRKMMDPVCIVALGKLPSRSDDGPGSEISGSDDDQSSEKDDESFLGAAEYECKTLQEKLGENAAYKALVMARKGSISAALTILMEFEESGAVRTKKDFLLAVSAHIRLIMAIDEFKNHANLIFLDNNVFTLPSSRLSSQLDCQIQDRSKSAQKMHLVRDNIIRILECLMNTHKRCATIEKVDLVMNLCRDIGFALFLKNQILDGDLALDNNNSSVLTGYYLDMAKSIGLRREFQHCVDRKLLVSRNKTMNGVGWPRRIGDFEYLDSRIDDDWNPRRSSSLLSGQMVACLANFRDIYQQEHSLTDADFQTQFIDILPPHWTVCSLTMDSARQELYVIRYCAHETPTVVKLPLNRAGERQCRWNPVREYCGMTYEQAVSELEDIIQRSDETIHSNKETLLMEDVENWWATRSKLDTRMKKLLEQIERTWIGGFKGLFCGRHHVCEQAFISFRQSIHHIFLANIYGSSSPLGNKPILNIDERTLQMILRLGANPVEEDVEDTVYFILACYESHGICINYSSTIIMRITQQLRHYIQSYHDQAALSGIKTLERLPNEHIILIPDILTQIFPWESLPTLRSQPVSRLPCISFLRDRILYGRLQKLRPQRQQPYYQENCGGDVTVDDSHLNENGSTWTDITVDSSMSYYLLNPTGDLKYTQAKFENIFSKMPGWEGHVQSKPSEIECRSMLMEKDLYMYFGHGAGQSLIRGQVIRHLPRCPVALLMGCSSGRLQPNGEFDIDGYVMNYLLAGSPAVVVNLWDVTDKSIDQVSHGLMGRWGLFSNATNQVEFSMQSKFYTNMSLVEALSLSRDDCPLPYLTSAATVVYGVPVYVL